MAASPRPHKDPAGVLSALAEEPPVAVVSRSALLARWTGPLPQPGLQVGRRVPVSVELIRVPKVERPAAHWFSHPLKSLPFCSFSVIQHWSHRKLRFASPCLLLLLAGSLFSCRRTPLHFPKTHECVRGAPSASSGDPSVADRMSYRHDIVMTGCHHHRMTCIGIYIYISDPSSCLT